MSGIQFEPDTKETRKKMQMLARHVAITKLLQDISMDMRICDIEGWDKTEYLRMIQEALPKCK